MNPARPWPERRELLALCRLLAWQFPLPRLTRQQLEAVPRLSALRVPEPATAVAAATVEGTIAAWREHAPAALVLFHDKDYPAPLREIARPPLALFIEGEAEILAAPSVAIVGARAATASYRAWTHDLAADLARYGVVVGSGLARGIDAAAHEGALAAGGKTFAVVGAGCDVAYPREHGRLREQIARQGCVASELPPGTPPRPWHFPSRNRILAGLSRGVVVVQAERHSGALITARFALHENRDVMAVPGDVQDPRSRGPHALLRAGAALVENAADVCRALGWGLGLPSPSPRKEPASEQSSLLAALESPSSVESLRARLGWEAGRLQRTLIELELLGLVERDAGGVRRAPSC